MRAIIRIMCIVLCVWLLLINSVTDGKRILAIIVAPLYSHQIVFRSLCMALNKRGHELVVVTSKPMRDPTLKNYTEIELLGIDVLAAQHEHKILSENSSMTESNKRLLDLVHASDVMIFNQPEFVKLYRRDSNEKFDAVIVEAVAGLSLFAMAHRFKAPLIGEMTSASRTCRIFFANNVYD